MVCGIWATFVKAAIEGTDLAQVYMFEAKDAFDLSVEVHYVPGLEISDICIFLIDNVNSIKPSA